MKKTFWWNPRIGPVTLVVLLLVAHAILKAYLSNNDMVSSIFAAGPHVPARMLFLTGLFVAVRLGTFLLVPGLLVWRVILLLLNRVGQKQSNIA